MELLRTPDERFSKLPDWPYEPHYTEIPDGEGGILRIHHAEDGPPDGPTILMLHGEPTWGYLYRKIMPSLAEAGVRSLVPDQVGFGRSDKPASRDDYSYARHVDWMQAWLDANGGDSLFFFGQDWGGLVGLRLVASNPERFAGLVVSNTGLPDGRGEPTEAFLAWQKFSQTAERFPIGTIVNGGCVNDLASEVVDAYNAPFPDDSFKEGARIWPSLVPTSVDDPAVPANRAAWEVLEAYEQPVVCAFSDGDPVTRGGEHAFQSRVPGAADQPHTTVEGAGHFVQEDRPEEVVRVLIDLVARVG
ncbi:MAG: haloalkane dehalogenase [Actinomycetota bacterium]|nr:haloalkane dehalogenase [Actinomycetota bacterium]